MVVVLCLALFTTRIVLKELGVTDYGIYNVVCGFVLMFSFLNTSMSNGFQRFFNFELGKKGEETQSSVFSTAILIQIVLSVAVGVILEVIGCWYLHNKMVIPMERMEAAGWIFQFSVLSFIAGIMQAPYAALVTAHEKFDFYAIISVLDAILKFLVVCSLAFFNFDKLIIYGLLILVISVFDLAIYLLYCRIKFKKVRFKLRLEKKLFKEMLSFSGWNLIGSFSGVMKEQGINLVINLFFGPLLNAARGIAAQVNSAIQGFVGNILTPVRPQVVQSYAKGDINRTFNLTYSISKFSSLFFLLMAVPVSFEIDYILKIWLGDNVPEYTSIFTILVFATTLVNILNGALSSVVHASGKMKNYQLWGSIIIMLSVPVSYFLLKTTTFPEIPLIVVFICSTVGHFVGLYIARKIVGISILEYSKKVIYPIVIVFILSILFVCPFHYILEEGGGRLCIVSFFSIIGIFLFSYIFAINKSERELVIQLLKSYKFKFKS